ncbi:MAG TPA: hypothetical protein VF760_14400 [Xanthobacteraceae bacterium]
MTQTIRLQSDSNAHDRPWRVAVEQGFFAAEGLEVEYHEDNPKGTAGRVEDFSQRWKESQLQKGALEVYPVCEWGAIERVQSLGCGKIIGLDTTVRTGALMALLFYSSRHGYDERASRDMRANGDHEPH